MKTHHQRRGSHRQDGGGGPTFFDIVSLALRDVGFLVRVWPHEVGVFSHAAR